MGRATLPAWCLPLALSGCFLFSSGPSSEVTKTPDELRKARLYVPPIHDAFPFGPLGKTPAGSWARYRVAEKGNSYELLLAVVGRDSEGAWVEIVEEGPVRRVSLRRVSPARIVLRAYYREIRKGSPPGEVLPQEIRHGGTRGRDPGQEVDRSEKKGRLSVGRREIAVTTVEREIEDFDGRSRAETWIWSAEAPALFAGAKAGGLVRKKTPEQKVDLLEWGTGYKGLIPIP